jgi:hypothetical protein
LGRRNISPRNFETFSLNGFVAVGIGRSEHSGARGEGRTGSVLAGGNTEAAAFSISGLFKTVLAAARWRATHVGDTEDQFSQESTT